MGIFDKFFRGKKEKTTKAKSGSRGVQTLVEYFIRESDIISTSQAQGYINRAKEELKREGAPGSRAMADLINELLACRSKHMILALSMALDLPAVPELIKALRSVASASALTVALMHCRFTPEIRGRGTFVEPATLRFGWTTGTHKIVKELAQETLDVLTGEKTKEEVLKARRARYGSS